MKLEDFEIKNGVLTKYYGDSETITIPEGVKEIGDYAFAGCPSAIHITLPLSVKSIGNSAFACCWNLKEILIPEKVNMIKDFAFSHCERLRFIKIPAHAQLGEKVFHDCYWLKYAIVPSTVVYNPQSVFPLNTLIVTDNFITAFLDKIQHATAETPSLYLPTDQPNIELYLHADSDKKGCTIAILNNGNTIKQSEQHFLLRDIIRLEKRMQGKYIVEMKDIIDFFYNK